LVVQVPSPAGSRAGWALGKKEIAMVGKRTSVDIKTKLSVKECASLFERSMRVPWFSNLVGNGTAFSEPPESVFSDLVGDRPTFSLMASLGGGGSEMQATDVVMCAWDRGDWREIQVRDGKALFSLGIKSKMKVRKFVSALQNADPSAECDSF